MKQRGVERIDTTLWELVSVANEIGSDEREAVAVVATLLASRVVRPLSPDAELLHARLERSPLEPQLRSSAAGTADHPVARLECPQDRPTLHFGERRYPGRPALRD